MPVAELAGHAPKGTPRSEDALTGAAFGLLTLLEPEVALVPRLREGRRVDGTRLAVGPVVRCDALFWPRLGTRGVDEAEPDVVLTLVQRGGDVTVLLIEAKYQSGPSGWPGPPADEHLRGQLGREWAALLAAPPGRLPGKPLGARQRNLMYVTAEAHLPATTAKRNQAHHRAFAVRLEDLHGMADLERLLVEPLTRLAAEMTDAGGP